MHEYGVAARLRGPAARRCDRRRGPTARAGAERATSAGKLVEGGASIDVKAACNSDNLRRPACGSGDSDAGRRRSVAAPAFITDDPRGSPTFRGSLHDDPRHRRRRLSSATSCSTGWRRPDEPVVNLDALTYAGNLENLASLQGDARHVFVAGRHHRPRAARPPARRRTSPRAIVHFAAETHVDRTIHGPGDFIRTNVEGTFTLLEARARWLALDGDAKAAFRFHHVSTDEVYGSLSAERPAVRRDRTPTSPTARTRPARRPATTWSAPGTTPTACRWSRPTAATTTARTTSPRS